MKKIFAIFILTFNLIYVKAQPEMLLNIEDIDIEDVSIDNSNNIYIGGAFEKLGRFWNKKKFIARITPNFKIDSKWNSYAFSHLLAIQVDEDGIYTISPFEGLVRRSKDGIIDKSFTPFVDANGFRIIIDDSLIYASSFSNLYRLKKDGQPDSLWIFNEPTILFDIGKDFIITCDQNKTIVKVSKVGEILNKWILNTQDVVGDVKILGRYTYFILRKECSNENAVIHRIDSLGNIDNTWAIKCNTSRIASSQSYIYFYQDKSLLRFNQDGIIDKEFKITQKLPPGIIRQYKNILIIVTHSYGYENGYLQVYRIE